jgi:membrane fusion protein (multidrug efflux system)
MPKKAIFIICLIAAIALAIFALFYTKKSQFAAMGGNGERQGPPPETISTFKVQSQEWTTYIRSIGSLKPIQGVDLESEIPGVITEINFENGQIVERGAALVKLDVKVEEAQLRALEASAKLARIGYERSSNLVKSGSITQAQFDESDADLERAEAEVENLKAVIARKTIRAPFTGKVGIRTVNLGQYVTNGTPIVSLQANDKVYVNFKLPEQALAQIEMGMPLTLTTDVYEDMVVEGEITAISPAVDQTSRTVEVQGIIDNESGKLRSGLFVRVEIALPNPKQVLVIPSTAVMYAPYGDTVFVLKMHETEGELPTVKQQFIRIDRRQGDFVSITKGLEADDEVVSAGAFKLRNNLPVKINNELKPDPKLNPTPGNS